MLRSARSERDQGFTLIELLVVLVIIGIIAGIAIPVFLNQRNKAAMVATKSNIRNLMPEIVTARENKQQSLRWVTGSTYTAGVCINLNPLPRVDDPGFATSACGAQWLASANNLASAAGSPPESIQRLLTDGWGRPILIDENEGEGTPPICTNVDSVRSGGPNGYALGTGAYAVPIPQSGFC